jgi:hypothetical protein
MTAEEKTVEMKMPKGAGFMASQSVGNLQGCCLSVVAIVNTLDASWQPWRHGHARLSELPIEQWFAFLRAQSPNSQLSARGFFQASCRMSLKHNKQLMCEKPVPAGSQGALSEDEFFSCRYSDRFDRLRGCACVFVGFLCVRLSVAFFGCTKSR